MRVLPKKSLSSEKTRSAAAEFGVKEKTIRAAAAQAGNYDAKCPYYRYRYSSRVTVRNNNLDSLDPKPKLFGGIWIDLE
jgi:hypothetical protein